MASDYRQFPLWAQEPEAAKAAVTCTAALGLRYRVKGNVVEPIPSPEGLPRELQGKFLWLNLSGEGPVRHPPGLCGRNRLDIPRRPAPQG